MFERWNMPRKYAFCSILIFIAIPPIESSANECPTQEAQNEGYVLRGNKYYKLYDDPSEWKGFEEAEAKCNEFGAHLAMYKTAADHQIVAGYAVQVGPLGKHLRVGLLNKRMTPECDPEWRTRDCIYWIDGSGPLNAGDTWVSMDWNQLMPCCEMNPSGHCGDWVAKCHVAIPFLCQLDCDNLYEAPSEPATCPDGAVPDGYEPGFDGKYYKVTEDRLTYWNGMLECHKDNARVAMADTAAALASIKYKSLNGAHADSAHWIGQMQLSDSVCLDGQCQGSYYYVDGRPWKMEDWMTGVTFQTETIQLIQSESCAAINHQYDSSSYEVITRNCENNLAAAICQFECGFSLKPAADSSCPNLDDNYVNFMGGFYHMNQNSANFASAKSHCEDEMNGALLDTRDPQQIPALEAISSKTSRIRTYNMLTLQCQQRSTSS